MKKYNLLSTIAIILILIGYIGTYIQVTESKSCKINDYLLIEMNNYSIPDSTIQKVEKIKSQTFYSESELNQTLEKNNIPIMQREIIIKGAFPKITFWKIIFILLVGCGLLGNIFFNLIQTRDYRKLEKDKDDALTLLNEKKNELSEISKRVQFGKNTPYDKQFDLILQQMEDDTDVEIGILNYTKTSYPKNFAYNLAKTISNAINLKLSNYEYKSEFVNNEFFIDWFKILNAVNTVKEEETTLVSLVNLLNIQTRELTLITNSLITSETNKGRDKYLVHESYWLIPNSNGDTVKRMYYLNPNDEDVIRLSERFLFACSTVVNCMCSKRYSLAILPAKLNTPYWQDASLYTVVYGATKKVNTPPTWVLSGLRNTGENGSSENEKLDFMFIQCTKTEDSVVGAKCSHIAGHLRSIWDNLVDHKLVLFDGTTLYLARICQIAEKIEGKIKDNSSKTQFSEKFSAFKNRIQDLKNMNLNFDINCNNYLEKEVKDKNDGEIWDTNLLKEFNTKFLNVDNWECKTEGCIFKKK